MMINLSELMFGDCLRLRFVKRYNRYPRIVDESVAEHMYYVTLFAMMVGREIDMMTCSMVDWQRLMSRCVIHDLDEAIVGDADGPLKASNLRLKSSLEQIGIAAIMKISKRLNAEELRLDVPYEFAKNNDLEGHIVRLADSMSVVQYVASEVELGNASILERAADVRRQVRHGRDKTCEVVRPYFDSLLEIAVQLYEENRR